MFEVSVENPVKVIENDSAAWWGKYNLMNRKQTIDMCIVDWCSGNWQCWLTNDIWIMTYDMDVFEADLYPKLYTPSWIAIALYVCTASQFVQHGLPWQYKSDKWWSPTTSVALIESALSSYSVSQNTGNFRK